MRAMVEVQEPQVRRTALVVDDDPEIRKLITRYLELQQFTVRTGSDYHSALSLLDAARPDLLCLDLMLPEGSGFEVCEHILATPALRGLPILMISARSMPEDRAMAEELGVTSYLPKPFTHGEFSDAVKALFDPEVAP